ncbi:unnamed protein product [Miscanthus lutarioriparius]|uniref:F-box domain-containing protein n=1 Tax=Miscanthus lutarioriparius TaxID=422564 RepID=A0A811R9W9_9POAL|nr:unnamed protein product [Miscanthus lutarioriparius]
MSSPPAHPDAGDPTSPPDARDPPAHPDAGDPASQPVFPDEILEEIFLRLDAMEDIARASAACTAFRRAKKPG